MVTKFLDTTKEGELLIALNLQTMVHRLLARCPVAAAMAAKDTDGTKPNEEVTLKWCLNTQYDSTRVVSLMPFSLKDNKSDQEYNVKLPSPHHIHLRPEQARSLSWMVQRETPTAENYLNGLFKNFTNVEIEEATQIELGYRAEVRAEWEQQVLGGVLADDVGYGKTVTILALIWAQIRLAWKYAKKQIPGRVAVKATFIDVPKFIANQWKEQTAIVLGTELVVLVIKDVSDLIARTWKEWIEADIIIFLEGSLREPPLLGTRC